MTNDGLSKYIPLSEATYYILLMLAAPRHGYAVMQEIERITAGAVAIGPGTLYGAFATLEKEGLIAMAGEETRRKIYTLTAKGREVLRLQLERLELMARNGREVLR